MAGLSKAMRIALAAGSVALISAAMAQAGTPHSGQAEVFAAERAFAKSMAERDFAAFGRLIAADTLFFGNSKVHRGRDAVLAAWKGFFEGPQAPFSWEPDQVEVLDSGQLALSTGPVRNPQGQVIARYNSIWQRGTDGRWLIIFAKGSPPDPPAK
jgi:ketosteroid isomerase-like protein